MISQRAEGSLPSKAAWPLGPSGNLLTQIRAPRGETRASSGGVPRPSFANVSTTTIHSESLNSSSRLNLSIATRQCVHAGGKSVSVSHAVRRRRKSLCYVSASSYEFPTDHKMRNNLSIVMRLMIWAFRLIPKTGIKAFRISFFWRCCIRQHYL